MTERRKESKGLPQLARNVNIAISPLDVGLFIGKNGHRIEAMKTKSGARIWIRDNNAIIVSGEKLQIKIAVELINKQIQRKDSGKSSVDSNKSKSSSSNLSDEYGPDVVLELTLNKNKIKLSPIESHTKEDDLLGLYPDSKVKPKILVRSENGISYATLTYANPSEASAWAKVLSEGTFKNQKITRIKK